VKKCVEHLNKITLVEWLKLMAGHSICVTRTSLIVL